MATLVPLSSLILEVSDCIRSVQSGASLNDVLPKVTHRAATQSLAFYVLRQYYLCQKIKEQLLTKKSPNPKFDSLLLVSIALLLPSKSPEAPVYAEFTVVDEAVKACSRHPKTKPFKGLLNACLRSFLRSKLSMIEQAESLSLEAKYGFPIWWQKRLEQDYGEQRFEIMERLYTPGPMVLRVNQRVCTPERYLEKLQQNGMNGRLVGDSGIILDQACPVDKLPDFEKGACSVQDSGAQLAATLLPLQKGMRVLDACSAPGGKTAHLLEREDISLTALDIDAKRMEKVRQNLERLGLMGDRVCLKVADAAKLETWWDGECFDMILADVPCTASGIVRRHPDIRLLRKESDIAQTASLQREIISRLWQVLKPGGTLLYATCSIFKEEGPEQLEYFKTLAGIELIEQRQLLPSVHDGFYYAKFQKRA
ncbi:16S rRNA (cytosine(967)-C(5))-methyltransferase RsmB [Basilea psittacipulmonis]|uniref:SAM-dependent MTase RsmB/NOP-type domain-containing protein n=1 Tax=Basilea psittacipulmonis DSM 24701 TaxID=1072685 RepID=A0A077DBP9_9BURK|nr:16S rRNA (cytosine(967)-C(5))-methyltransferase RsmB [Basilea psittacipulmonis]AIL32089.1 hypothetical protein IX83_01005 [Basilea psittacipulmonis DSM 24701]